MSINMLGGDLNLRKKNMSKVLGIDLGTTNSCMCVMDGGDPLVLENSEGKRTTPSVVAFSKSGENAWLEMPPSGRLHQPQEHGLFGEAIHGAKNLTRLPRLKRVPYTVAKAANGDVAVEVEINGETKQFSPPEISAMILSKLKADAESRLGETITQAVITVLLISMILNVKPPRMPVR